MRTDESEGWMKGMMMEKNETDPGGRDVCRGLLQSCVSVGWQGEAQSAP